MVFDISGGCAGGTPAPQGAVESPARICGAAVSAAQMKIPPTLCGRDARTTTSQHHNIATSQHHNITTPQHHNVTPMAVMGGLWRN